MSILVISLVFVGAVSTVSAKEGYIDDHLVTYNYWNQNELSTYWTGVVNKVSYDQFAPCVGARGGGYECGGVAYESQYKEFGLKIDATHTHCLHSSNYGRQYYIE